MPCGSYRPLANTEICCGLALPTGTRNTWTELDIVLATNKSPLGATRITRVLRRSDVTSSAEKPSGTCGRAPAGMGTTCTGPLADAEIGGRSCGLISRLTPGLSSCQPPKAAEPCSTCPKARSLPSRLRQQAAMPKTLSEYPVILYMTTLLALQSAVCDSKPKSIISPPPRERLP